MTAMRPRTDSGLSRGLLLLMSVATGLAVAGLVGHPPRDIADFVRDHAAAFTPAGSAG
jgi:hypothetical protein